MKFAGPGLCLLFAVSLTATGAEEFTDARGRIDEVVADTTDSPAPSALEPLKAPIPFQNFRYPYVDANQNVTFIADDPLHGADENGNMGIYRSYASDGRLEALVSATTTAPGTSARFRNIRGLHFAEDLTNFVFSSITTDNRNGIYLWEDGELSVIARSGETRVGGELVTDVEYASYSGNKVLYVAHTDSGPRLVLCDLSLGNSQAVLVRSGEAMPGVPGATFEYLSPQNWIDGNQVLFRAARIPDPNIRENGERKAVRGLYGWVGKTNYKPSELKRFADWTTAVPGFASGIFLNFRSAPVRNDLITFQGSGKDFSGMYWMKTTDTVLKPIVDSSTEMETLFKGAFHGFSLYPSIIDRSIIFTAYAEDYVGIFLYRPDDDQLFVLTDSRATVGGKKITDFETASFCMVGNRLAVKAGFSDGSQGVYLANVPGVAVSR